MRPLDRHAFFILFHLPRAHLQHAHRARRLFSLGADQNHGALVEILLRRAVASTRQPTPRGRQPGHHERRAAEHEAHGPTIDAQRLEAGRVLVREAQMRERHVVHVLVEQWNAVERVQRRAVGPGAATGVSDTTYERSGGVQRTISQHPTALSWG